MKQLPITQGELLYDPEFLLPTDAEQLYNTLEQQLNWRQDSIRMFGRIVKIPRLQCFQGEPGISYLYSGLTLYTTPWHPAIEQLKLQIETISGFKFNSVLINFYRDGKDSMGWHSDDEPELGPEPVIASISLGQPRRFLLRHRSDKSIPPQELLLNSGSLLIMAGQLQHYWHHSVPKTSRQMAGRINLTFRQTQQSEME